MKSLPAKSRRLKFDPWVIKIPCRRKWQPTPVFVPGKSHGQRSLAGYSPWCRKELDTTSGEIDNGSLDLRSYHHHPLCSEYLIVMEEVSFRPLDLDICVLVDRTGTGV